MVHDPDQGKAFDIDQMSSGEKGLVLTFLFLRLSMCDGGIVLLDEPELHLNAAVQAKLLAFLEKRCADALGVQLFVCTHSPELVKDAYENEACRLFHLRSADDLTPVLPKDNRELFSIFERLGSSPAEVLFTRGNLYVEGEHDCAVIQAGFSEALTGIKVAWLGGRAEIERELPNLQAEEKAGRLKKVNLFILDNDKKPTKIKTTNCVKVHQHERYCLENYLLNADIIYDLVSAHAKKSVESRGMFPKCLEEVALAQTADLAMQETYHELVHKSPEMKVEHFKGKPFNETAKIMSSQLSAVKDAMTRFNQDEWEKDFVNKCTERKQQLDAEWRSKWRNLSNGKKIMDDLYVKYEITMKKVEFKKAIINKMAENATDDW